jgi:nucleotide-binding universal stress UspA family protein
MADVKVVVPLDGSELAESALRYVPILACLGAIELRLVAVVDDEVETGTGDEEQRERETRLLNTYLEEQGQRLVAPGLSVQTQVMIGAPSAGILKAAESCTADFIVISTHGRSGLQRWRLGSVADKVIRGATCGTLVIGPKSSRLADKLAVRSLLVPLDGSALAEQALPVARRLADALAAELHLMRVVPPQVLGEDIAGVSYSLPLLESVIAAAESYTARVAARTHADRKTVELGPPSECLLQYVEENSIDLIVATTHGRGGLLRSALGSVTDRLLGGPAPVLVVRPTPAAPA